MTLLFSLHLSRHVDGMVKGPVKAAECGLVGHYASDGKPYQPDNAATRECLPYRYRRAFDRGSRWWWTSARPDLGAYCTLLDRRGRYLNTVYAVPYTFVAKGPQQS